MIHLFFILKNWRHKWHIYENILLDLVEHLHYLWKNLKISYVILFVVFWLLRQINFLTKCNIILNKSCQNFFYRVQLNSSCRFVSSFYSICLRWLFVLASRNWSYNKQIILMYQPWNVCFSSFFLKILPYLKHFNLLFSLTSFFLGLIINSFHYYHLIATS